jgi:PIN domain nuclease of toxin-antitoxin system
MRLLLDTNVVIRLSTNAGLVPRATMARLEDPVNQVFASVVCFWEIAIKHRVGKLALDVAGAREAMAASRVATLGIGERHLRSLERLPVRAEHRDPFDHLLVAQALAEGLTLVTAHRALASYGADILLG